MRWNNAFLFSAIHFLYVLSALPCCAKVTRESCSDFLQISIKGKPVDFSGELFTLTENNLVKAINKANREIARRDNLLDADASRKLISRLHGVALCRLSGSSDINCIIGVDNALNHLVIVDSYHKEEKGFTI